MKKIVMGVSIALVISPGMHATILDTLKEKFKQTRQEVTSEAEKLKEETLSALRNKFDSILFELQTLQNTIKEAPSLADQLKAKINDPNGLLKHLEQKVTQQSTAFSQAIEQLKEKVTLERVKELLKNIGNSIESSNTQALAQIKETLAAHLGNFDADTVITFLKQIYATLTNLHAQQSITTVTNLFNAFKETFNSLDNVRNLGPVVASLFPAQMINNAQELQQQFTQLNDQFKTLQDMPSIDVKQTFSALINGLITAVANGQLTQVVQQTTSGFASATSFLSNHINDFENIAKSFIPIADHIKSDINAISAIKQTFLNKPTINALQQLPAQINAQMQELRTDINKLAIMAENLTTTIGTFVTYILNGNKAVNDLLNVMIISNDKAELIATIANQLKAIATTLAQFSS